MLQEKKLENEYSKEYERVLEEKLRIIKEKKVEKKWNHFKEKIELIANQICSIKRISAKSKRKENE